MADGTHIEWTDATWNVVTGCSVVSPGCTNCYAMKLAGTRLRDHPSRQGLTIDSKAGPVWNGQVRFNAEWLTQPLRWTKPRRIFVAAHGDLFHEGVTDAQLDQIFAVMALCPQHTFQVLTKRPERMRAYLTDGSVVRRIWTVARDLTYRNGPSLKSWRARIRWHQQFARDTAWTTLGGCASDMFLREEPRRDYPTWVQWPLRNVWLGVSAEDQARADERIPVLLDTPAAVRWISAEPLLGPIDLARWTATARVTCKACAHEFDLHRADPCRHQAGGSWTLACPACGRCVCRRGWSEPDDRSPPMGPPADWIEKDVGRFSAVHPTIPLHSALDWVVAGGESGPGARPMHPDWARQLRDQCAAAGAPFLFKQWGAWECQHDRDVDDADWRDSADIARWPNSQWLNLAGGQGFHGERVVRVCRVGKKAAGRVLDGQLHDGFPGARR